MVDEIHRKNRILVVSAGFFPAKKYGGPVTSLINFVSCMENSFDIYILTLNHDYRDAEPFDCEIDVWQDYSRSHVKYLSDRLFSSDAVLKEVNQMEIDLVYLNNFYNISVSLPTLSAFKKSDFPLLLAFRGELMPGALSQKGLKKKAFIRAFKLLIDTNRIYYQSTSEAEGVAIRDVIGCAESRIVRLDNLPLKSEGYLSKKEKIAGSLKIVYVARIHPGKNLLYAIQRLRHIRGEVRFSVYGPIEDESYWEKCKEAISFLPSNIAVEYLGHCDPCDVPVRYRESHVMILPTVTENYGHSIVEAMISGCPVVISDATPWNSVNESQSGWAIPLSDCRSFELALQELTDMNQLTYDALLERNRLFVETHFDNSELVNRYKSSLNALLQSRWSE